MLKESQKTICSGIRLFSNRSYLDSITVVYKLLENPKELFKCLDVISNGNSFTNNKSQEEYKELIKTTKRQTKAKSQQTEGPEKKYRQLFPRWLNPSKGATICQWICAFLEESLVCRSIFN